ncbi:MAG: Superoxide reductase [Candidatus Ozemobacter sibiricus]|jgi:superoxide reductase|uniref:Desulfoferrodoxin n=1 Tax=Candidatus Ozemobacter sibiricus TaxID=2268124 RepID=A0A367ZP74_9BACT|nr:MAG: Superoxide reductase [Candidatus Ozemobacter sibiricus]
MPKLHEVYKCKHCGNVVEVVHAGAANLVCCGENMTHLVENTVDAAKEKHVPVVEETAQGLLVKVGSVTHPMEEKHYIEWIQLLAGEKSYTHFLKPGDKPEALFPIKPTAFTVREHCNLHGLWAASK